MSTLIVANWKMNPMTVSQAEKLFSTVDIGISAVKDVQVVLCPPFVYLDGITPNSVQLGAQDCSWKDKGSFTGEVSPVMLKGLGCSYVILGHSERKRELGETLQVINKKVLTALRVGLRPIVCVGESSQVSSGRRVLARQLRAILRDVPSTKVSNVIVAYEPEWAISSDPSSKAASPDLVRSSIESIRNVLKQEVGEKKASSVPVLYGGSTDSSNIRSYLEGGGANGALVGSAALKGSEFIKLVKKASLE